MNEKLAGTHPLVNQLRFARRELIRCLEGVSQDDAIRRLEPMNWRTRRAHTGCGWPRERHSYPTFTNSSVREVLPALPHSMKCGPRGERSHRLPMNILIH